jgi:UDP-N-acetylglucosamine--N-acetylmuramyl-(pentapeptide) pyrophosphoryl-undecaprenol N-acetylglucosamine transferase
MTGHARVPALPAILLTAGGTGGHVFPAEALAAALAARGVPLAFMTDRRGQAYGGMLGSLPTHRVAAGALLGKGLLGRVGGALSLLRGTLQARRVLKRLRPAVVVGFGGYASVPAVAAARQLGIPFLMHEQNAVLGRANRLFAGQAACIATSFATVAHLPKGVPTLRTGMPVRPAIGALAGVPYRLPRDTLDPIEVLILGGSQGARVFTDVLPRAFRGLPAGLERRLRISQQVRPEDEARAAAAYAGSGLDVTLRTFFDDVPERLARCHLLIARAGASTVAEATVAGRPSLLVPYPHAADDHQRANARAIDDAGAGWMVPQEDFTSDHMVTALTRLLGERLAAAAAAARAFALPEAAAALADAVVALLPDPPQTTTERTAP